VRKGRAGARIQHGVIAPNFRGTGQKTPHYRAIHEGFSGKPPKSECEKTILTVKLEMPFFSSIDQRFLNLARKSGYYEFTLDHFGQTNYY
jgi:hypothetical protein